MRCRYTTQSVRHKAATYFVLYHLQYESYDQTTVRTAQVMNAMSNALYYTLRYFLFVKSIFYVVNCMIETFCMCFFVLLMIGTMEVLYEGELKH